MKLISFLIIAGLIIILGIQVFNSYKENRELVHEGENLKAEVDALISEGQELRDDIEYFADPDNLAKELKEDFDYKRPGETLIKVQ